MRNEQNEVKKKQEEKGIAKFEELTGEYRQKAICFFALLRCVQNIGGDVVSYHVDKDLKTWVVVSF